MPMYEYQCDECDTRVDEVRKIIDRNTPFPCDCGGVFEHGMFTAPAGHVQEECHYVCPATGIPTTSWRQRKNIFAKNDLVMVDPDEHKEKTAKVLKKKEKRDNLAKGYLPKDLMKQVKTIGTKQGFVA